MVTDSVAGARVNRAPATSTIGDIVGAYKSLVANDCLEILPPLLESFPTTVVIQILIVDN